MIFYIGRRAPKGYEELAGSMHLGKGIWLLKIQKKKTHFEVLKEGIKEMKAKEKIG